MPSPVDANVQLPGGTQTGPQVRTQQLYVLDGSTLVPVQMQVVQIADDQGTIIADFTAYNVQIAVLAELRRIRQLLAARNGTLELIDEDPSMAQQS